MGLNQAEKFIPGARWLRGYKSQYAIADFIAGITVGLTMLPQGLAYATLAGLEPQVSGGCCYYIFQVKFKLKVLIVRRFCLRSSSDYTRPSWEGLFMRSSAAVVR